MAPVDDPRTSTNRLTGKVALITGSSRGIGAATAMRLAREGALCLVHSVNNAGMAAAVVESIAQAGGRALSVKGDLAKAADIRAMFEAIDRLLTETTGCTRIDVLVNNAALSEDGFLETLTEADIDRVIDVNFKGTFLVTQAAVARMGDGGRVIMISSLSATRANPARVLYTATKGALNALTLSLAQHLGPRGITVNAIMPGLVATEMATQLPQDVREHFRSQIALGRIGEPEDIADAVALLASPDARWITGQWIAVSGGQRL